MSIRQRKEEQLRLRALAYANMKKDLDRTYLQEAVWVLVAVFVALALLGCA